MARSPRCPDENLPDDGGGGAVCGAAEAAAAEFDAVRAVCVPGSGFEVTWSTRSEMDTLGFRVEYSTDLGPFQLATSPVAARGAPSFYVTLDVHQSEQHWYRVVELTSNGPGVISPVVPAEEPAAPEEGNVLLATRAGRDVVFSFAAARGAYRRLNAGTDPRSLATAPPASPNLATTTWTDLGALDRSISEYYRLNALSPCSHTPGP